VEVTVPIARVQVEPQSDLLVEVVALSQQRLLLRVKETMVVSELPDQQSKVGLAAAEAEHQESVLTQQAQRQLMEQTPPPVLQMLELVAEEHSTTLRDQMFVMQLAAAAALHPPVEILAQAVHVAMAQKLVETVARAR
jgi:hypothetical protein